VTRRQEIWRYARALLPRGERGIRAIRNGPDPKPRRVARNHLSEKIYESTLDIADRVESGGSVAIITYSHRRLLELETLVQRRGVRKSPDSTGTLATWQLRSPVGTQVRLYISLPSDVRGLEFDGVVVVEPDEFPSPLGHRGELYTSLTRANKELYIVYATRLPKELPSSSRR